MRRLSVRHPIIAIWDLKPEERLKVLLLATWLFFSVATLWLLKPIRTAALLSHFGAAELPYLRVASALAVGLVAFGYSRLIRRYSRLGAVRGTSLLFAATLVLLWVGLRLGGHALREQRWFVWGVFILVDIYSTLMVAMFWTYTNDVVSRLDADRLYIPIGVGGILGGVAGGVAIDTLVARLGPVETLLAGAAFVLIGGGLASATEALVKLPVRAANAANAPVWADAVEGARSVLGNAYLLSIVGIVVAYEFAAVQTDFVINVIFEGAFQSELELMQMYGRLGWIVSATALVTQLLLVPVLLPTKRVALLVPPLMMAATTLGLAALPIASLAIAAAASDRGLNYSLQQVTKETMYVPLSDAERYRAKAFIDMFVDRAGKALSSIALLVLVAFMGISPHASLALAFVALAFWAACAHNLGRRYVRRVADQNETARSRTVLDPSSAPSLEPAGADTGT